MITTNDILTRLRNGESMDTIGQSIADVLNEAQEAYIAEQEIAKKEQAAQELAQAKRNLACGLIDLIQEYGELTAPEAAKVLDDIDDTDIDAMVATLDEMFHMMTAMAQLKAQLESLDKLPVPKAQTKSKITPPGKLVNSDDEVLANFIKTLM